MNKWYCKLIYKSWSNNEDGYQRLQPKVKHLIEYLSKLDPEMDVYLDKDGWDSHGENELELVENSYLFHVYNFGGKSQLTINN